MKKLIAFVLSLLLVVIPVFSDETETAVETTSGGYDIQIPESWTMGELLQYFIDSYGLNENNFAITAYCPDTGERCAFNETKHIFAASTYKLPLNMYFYERQAEGVYSDSTSVGNTTLANAHYLSIVHSNNEYSQTMIYMLGNFRTYKQKMMDAYGKLDESEISPLYYQDNYYCTKFMGNTLVYLYEHLDQFDELLGYLKQAMEGRYLKRHAGDVEVAHKYGVFYDERTQEHDVGILFTEQPVLLAIYTDGFRGGGIGAEELIARLGRAFINYQTQRTALDKKAAEEAEAAARAAAESEALAIMESESEAASEAASEQASEAASEDAQLALESALASEAVSEEASEAASEQAQQEAAARRQTILFAALGAGAVIVLLAVILLLAKRRKR